MQKTTNQIRNHIADQIILLDRKVTLIEQKLSQLSVVTRQRIVLTNKMLNHLCAKQALLSLDMFIVK